MPRSSSAWSARNYLGTTSRGVCVTYWLNLLQVVSITIFYQPVRPSLVWINDNRGVLPLSLNCQNIGSARPFLVTLNPIRVPDNVLHKWHTSHLNPSVASAKASLELNHIQGKRGLWFCGSYQGISLVTVQPALLLHFVFFSEMSFLYWITGYGFHEDGVKVFSAQLVLF